MALIGGASRFTFFLMLLLAVAAFVVGRVLLRDQQSPLSLPATGNISAEVEQEEAICIDVNDALDSGTEDAVGQSISEVTPMNTTVAKIEQILITGDEGLYLEFSVDSPFDRVLYYFNPSSEKKQYLAGPALLQGMLSSGNRFIWQQPGRSIEGWPTYNCFFHDAETESKPWAAEFENEEDKLSTISRRSTPANNEKYLIMDRETIDGLKPWMLWINKTAYRLGVPVSIAPSDDKKHRYFELWDILWDVHGMSKIGEDTELADSGYCKGISPPFGQNTEVLLINSYGDIIYDGEGFSGGAPLLALYSTHPFANAAAPIFLDTELS